jgi:serine/threonine-protein kinase
MILAAVLVSFVEWPAGKDVRAPGFFTGFAQIEVVVVLLAATGSGIIYGLRRQVSAAQQLGQYVLVEKIGEGGMGEVYLSRHLMLRRPTAVKLLLPDRVGRESLERFEREVVHTSQLTHPNTVAVFDYGRSPDGVFYYAMEYLGGGIDLENLVRKHGPQPSSRVAAILAQACGALYEAHTRGIIHRDIKPANMILCERGGMPDVVKVVDYGLVKDFTADTGASTQVVVGTPDYIAPEAFTDPANLSPAVDLYAIGCVGYYLLTGKKLFTGKTAMDICIQHVTKSPTPPSEVAAIHIDPTLEAIIMGCLEKSPSARPANAAELRRELLTVDMKEWPDAEARAWWQRYRETSQALATATEAPTTTMTVDLAARA